MTKSFIFMVVAVVGATSCSFFTRADDSNERQQRVRVTELWVENCASCHGENGNGGGAGTQTLLTRELFGQDYDRQFYDTIKNGSPDGGMDAYGETMSDELVWSLVVHIRELQSRFLRRRDGSPRSVDGVYLSQRHKFRVEDVVTSGLSTPWSLDWLPNGLMLVTNRPGGMHVYQGGRKIADVTGLPPVVQRNQGGQMEVSVHSSGWVYISVADPVKAGRGVMTRLYRGKIVATRSAARWTSQETIWEAGQEFYSTASVHFGCKIVFDGEGHVFFGMGERGTNMRVQDDSTPYGKVMRLNLDGSIPADNPVKGNPMWSTGHRNHQGLVFDLDGVLWDTEHGPRGGDEVNLIVKGSNYGWPIKALSINYNDSPFRIPWNYDGEDYVQPVFRWLPSTGASGLDVVDGEAFPNWKGDLLAGGLVGNNLDRFRMKDGKMVEREELLHGLGRVRDIAVHKDGTVYVILNGPDKIIRLVPAD
ncbi:MAG: PQQ-dependent sugar dehydrogenase [Armatimonadetes bacterium]|nr:PQQ-dependent sugar dehydrogenase [Armatimonadota bacterium]